MPIQKRDIAIAVILSLVTCGIYSYYWMYKLTEDSNFLSRDNSLDPALSIVFTIITCGIYGYYWAYKIGKNMATAQNLHGKVPNDNSVLYLVLAIFGFAIVDYALIQNDINDLVEFQA